MLFFSHACPASPSPNPERTTWPVALSRFRPVSASTQDDRKVSQRFLLSVWHSLSQVIHHPQRRLNMNTHMNIWITEQVVIVIHLRALCRGCKVFCLEPVVLLSRGFLTERLKWGRGEREHRCSWVASFFFFTEKEWPVSAKAPSACLWSFLLCPRVLFIQWRLCWHKDLPFAQMVDSRGSPEVARKQARTSYAREELPPGSKSVSEMQL